MSAVGGGTLPAVVLSVNPPTNPGSARISHTASSTTRSSPCVCAMNPTAARGARRAQGGPALHMWDATGPNWILLAPSSLDACMGNTWVDSRGV